MEQLPLRYFVSGGCRSGKSALALALAEHIAPRGLFIATATAFDASMQERIAAHQAERSSFWDLYEVPFGKGCAFAQNAATLLAAKVQPTTVILLDCLTLWVSNCMEETTDAGQMRHLAAKLVESIYQLPNPVIIVSNEVGLGVVPSSQTGRLFRDFVGIANQQAARKADHVVFTVSGLPLLVKGSLPTGFIL